jgi:hypothetical protein
MLHSLTRGLKQLVKEPHIDHNVCGPLHRGLVETLAEQDHCSRIEVPLTHYIDRLIL